MSQAAQYAPAGPEKPATRPSRLRFLLYPLGILLLLLAIPGGAYGFARIQLSAAQTSEAHSDYSQALDQYAVAPAIAGNPVLRMIFGQVADDAQGGGAESHFLWGVQLKQQGKFADGETQIRAAIKSGIAASRLRVKRLGRDTNKKCATTGTVTAGASPAGYGLPVSPVR